ncbi:MAG: RelA/SpoT family protein [Candidatus Gracilibacteria bacterium]|jgi:GTP pyrophosphokinase
MTPEKYKKFFDLDEIIKNIKSYLANFDEKRFIDAFNFAEEAHKEQFRKDGKTPYIIHPVATVKILTELHADEDILIAAMLHDVPEDTTFTIEQIKEKFGSEIAYLIDGITKLSKVHYQNNMPEWEVESLKKMFFHCANDLRVILIKLADRLHNMRTLKFIDKIEKRIRISRETLEIFIPIANLLGINIIKTELEDLCFANLFPLEFEKVKIKIKDSNDRNKLALKKIISTLNDEFAKNNISANIYPREKGLYRAYKRICALGKPLDSIKDRLAIKVVVENEQQCYFALGLIHKSFTPKLSSVKDYIASPKINGYQSLHTIVFGIDGILTEIQIQTKDMEKEAKYGIAFHFFNGEQKDKNSVFLSNDKRALWINKIIEMGKEKGTSQDFLSDLKYDIFQERIFVFTPKGETIDLPKGSSVIDFAFHIHSHIGCHALKADINGEISPITNQLKTGDVVKVIIDESSHPELNWLSFAHTNLAKNKILYCLKRVSRQKKIASGLAMLQKEFDIAGFGLCEDVSFKKIKKALNDSLMINIKSMPDLFASIGSGEIKTYSIIKMLKESKYKNSLLNDNSIKITVRIVGKNNFGLLGKISNIIYKHASDVFYIKGWASRSNEYANFIIKMLVDDTEKISHIFYELEQIEEIKFVYRVSTKGLIFLYINAFITAILWISHPFILRSTINNEIFKNYEYSANFSLFIYELLLILSLLYLVKMSKKYFLLIRTRKTLWFIAFLIPTIALAIFIFEINYLHLSSAFLSTIFAFIIAYLFLGFEYLKLIKIRRH